MNILAIIPARGGSKGILKKNIKPLRGKPLINYTIEVARSIFCDNDICVSTDSDEIIEIVEQSGLKVPFKRPPELSTDTATSNDVLLHALDFYEKCGIYYDAIVLLQPTSPLRTVTQIKEAVSLYHNDIDMVVSVRESHAPFVLCNENSDGYLDFVFNKNTTRRQDMSKYYEYNGAIYVINVQSLKNKGMVNFDKKVKYVMPPESSVDIDSLFDWNFVEYLIKSYSYMDDNLEFKEIKHVL
jgi:N-acylneuraminate cytidylyltransferase